MPASQIEQQASIRVYDRLDAKRKGNPSDIRTIFAGRIADKYQARCGIAETVDLVISDMESRFSATPGTIRMICQRQIARLLAAGDVAGRAHFIACLAEARRVGIIPRWLEKWDGLPRALAEADGFVQQAKMSRPVTRVTPGDTSSGLSPYAWAHKKSMGEMVPPGATCHPGRGVDHE